MRRRTPPRSRPARSRRALAAEDAFRRARGLLAAEDAERWLAERGVSLARWRSWVRRTVDPPRDRRGRPRALDRRLRVSAALRAQMRAARPQPGPAPPPARAGGGVLTAVRTRGGMDCGAAALASVCGLLGVDAAPADVRAAVGADPRGASLADLARAARSLGLHAEALKASKRNLHDLALPLIAHVDGDHWVVVHGLAGGAARVYDPARGDRRVPLDELTARWSGYALLVA